VRFVAVHGWRSGWDLSLASARGRRAQLGALYGTMGGEEGSGWKRLVPVGKKGRAVLFSSGGCQRWCACVVAMLRGEGVRCGLVVVVRGVH
jgi:hypothetical protein